MGRKRKAKSRLTNMAKAAHEAIKTSSAPSSSHTPHLSLPPYLSGKGQGTLSFSCALRSPWLFASTTVLEILGGSTFAARGATFG